MLEFHITVDMLVIAIAIIIIIIITVSRNEDDYSVAKFKKKLWAHLTMKNGRQFHDENKWDQWLKCNGTQGNAVPLPPVYGSKRSPTSDCYNGSERHMTIVRGPNLNVAFPHL